MTLGKKLASELTINRHSMNRVSYDTSIIGTVQQQVCPSNGLTKSTSRKEIVQSVKNVTDIGVLIRFTMVVFQDSLAVT